MLAHVQDINEQMPKRLRYYENPAGFRRRARGEIRASCPDKVEEELQIANDDARPQEYLSWCALR